MPTRPALHLVASANGQAIGADLLMDQKYVLRLLTSSCCEQTKTSDKDIVREIVSGTPKKRKQLIQKAKTSGADGT